MSETALRRDGIAQVTAALLPLLCGHGRIAAVTETPWRSATFCGARYHVTLMFEGGEACLTGEALRDVLPETEFTLAGRMVADAQVLWIQHQYGGADKQPKLDMQLDLLLLEDA